MDWDDFVGQAAALPSIGFEDHVAPEEPSLFSLARVQFALPSSLLSLACASNILLLTVTGTHDPQLLRIDLDAPSDVVTIDLPVSLANYHHRTHLDPSGKHALVSSTQGDNWYISLNATQKKVRQLSKLKGAVVNCVAWGTTSGAATNPILLGTAAGQIIETTFDHPESTFTLPVRGFERYVKLLYTLPERAPIVGLRAESWSRRGAVILATDSRIYQFIGPLALRKSEEDPAWESLFGLYVSENIPKCLELPGEIDNSELHFFAPVKVDQRGIPTSNALPKILAWLTGPGIYHGPIQFPMPPTPIVPGESLITSGALLPYPTEPLAPQSYGTSSNPHDHSEIPLSMLLTEWHMILLYPTLVRAVGLMSAQVVWEGEIDLPPDSHPIRLERDQWRNTIWIFSQSGIWELVIRDEDRDVWKIHLDRGEWDRAKSMAKSTTQRETVSEVEGDHHFNAGRYIPAAQCYAQSSKLFEQVVLSFVQKNERDALRYYLIARLERLKKTDLTQRMMLATWLIEIFLSKINQLEDFAAAERSELVENFNTEKVIVEEDMRQFLQTYKSNLDRKTVFDLLERHGRDELSIFFAQIVGDHERIITHWILAEDWVKAIKSISEQDNIDFYYRFGPVLMAHVPEETVEAFKRQPFLDVRKLIPAIVSPRKDPAVIEHSIKYLKHVIFELKNQDPCVHNVYVTLLVTQSSQKEADLINYLKSSSSYSSDGKQLYDLDYTLRLCRSGKKIESCVFIYSKMGLNEASVDLALEHDDLELAKASADQPEDDVVKKKLWLKLAKHVVGKKNDIKTAMRFLESTNLLKIEDILPFFPDFVVIDDFKEEICNALEDYSAHIEQLKKDMDDATQNAEVIKNDIESLNNRFVVVDAAEKCYSCTQLLLTRQFYVFPCQHSFHADCLITEVTKTLSNVSLRRMLDLQSRLSPSVAPANTRLALEDSSNAAQKIVGASVQGLDQLRKLVIPDALVSIVGSAIPRRTRGDGTTVPVANADKLEAEENQALKDGLDELLAKHCILCEGGIANIDRPFILDGETM